MPKISELATGTVASTDKLAVAQGTATIQATIAEVITAGGGGGGASVTVAATAPTSPGNGDLWYDTSVLELYVYVAAESSWIQTNGGSGGGGIDMHFFENSADPAPVAGWNTLESLGLPANTTQLVVFCRTNLLNSQTGTVSIATAHDGTNYNTRHFFACHHNLDRSCSQFTAPVIANNLGEAGIYIAWSNMETVRFEGYMTSGGAGGGGPRAYVAFDGSAADMATELAGANSLNVSSITDHGPGDYTINYTSPVSQPIITIGYQTRASTPFHALYWGVLAQTATSARIAIGSNNVYYDHPYVSFVAH